MKYLMVAAILLGSNHVLAQVNVNEMLDIGQTTAVYRSSSQGLCAVGVGLASATNSDNKDRAIARANAMDELGGLISGRSVSAETFSTFESNNGVSQEAFRSVVSTNSQSFLKGATVTDSGRFGSDRYVVVQACEKQIRNAQALAIDMSNNQIVALGYSSLSGGVERARRIALDSALRNAVSQYSGVSTASQTTVEDADNLRSRMATRTRGVVESYRILEEGKVSGEYRVEISAIVVEAPESNQVSMEAIQENLGRPSVFVDARDSHVRSALDEVFASNNFDVTRDRSSARFIVEVDSEVIEQKTLGEMIGRQTSLNIRVKDVLSADDSIVISNDPSTSLEVSNIEGLRASRSALYAVESIQDQLLNSLAGDIVDQFNNGAKVRISFSNFGKLRFVEGFLTLLEGLPLTKKASLRPVENGVAYYDLLYLGDPSELQLLIVKASVKHKLFGLKAKNRQETGLDFTF